MNQSELKQLNQNTITYLYQSIMSLQGQGHTQGVPPSSSSCNNHPQPPSLSSIQNSVQSHPALPKPIPQFQGQHEFEQRALEYQAMTAKPAPAPLQAKTDSDQRESQEAMERKWMEQQRLREKDLEQYSPPSQVSGPQAINLNLLKSTAPIPPPNAATPPLAIQPGVSSSMNIGIVMTESETIQLKVSEVDESVSKNHEEVLMENKPVISNESEWWKRLVRIEQLQEKMMKQMEEWMRHSLPKRGEESVESMVEKGVESMVEKGGE